MKQKILIFILLFFIFMNNTISGDLETNLEDTVDKIENLEETITDEEKRSEYLKQSWSKILESSFIGPVLIKIESVFSFLNPLFEIVLGLSFSFSWPFFLSLLIWILLLHLAFNFFSIFEVYLDQKYSQYVKWISFVVFFIFISSIRIPKIISLWIISLISTIDSWLIQLVGIIVVFIVLIYLFTYSSMIKSKFRSITKNKLIYSSKRRLDKQKGKIKRLEKRESKSKEKDVEDEIEQVAKADLEGIGKDGE